MRGLVLDRVGAHEDVVRVHVLARGAEPASVAAELKRGRRAGVHRVGRVAEGAVEKVRTGSMDE